MDDVDEADEEDVVVRTLNVYISTELANQITLLQFPLENKDGKGVVSSLASPSCLQPPASSLQLPVLTSLYILTPPRLSSFVSALQLLAP